MSYEEVIEEYKRISMLGDVSQLLNWDQQVMMPEKGAEARARQKSVLSSLTHDLITDDSLKQKIDDLNKDELDEKQKANLREIKRDVERSRKVPNTIVEKISSKDSEAFESWKKARQESDFSILRDDLKEMIELKKQYAKEIDPDRPVYEVLFEDYEPYISLEKTEEILEDLAEGLKPLLKKIRENGSQESSVLKTEVDQEKQESLARQLAKDIGFDFQRGRLDVSDHPFTSGSQFDARITARYSENLVEGISVTMHETGHALYQLGLSKEDYGTPAGSARELTIHESQSRFWENHVGRSKPFQQHLKKRISENLGKEFDTEEMFSSINEVKPENPIRVDSDELTYHMHILVRFKTEKAVFEDRISVDEIPEFWDDKMEELLGFRPENDAEGCLQDVHWAHGAFGYFPTYSLGSLLAAQIEEALRQDFEDFDEKIRSGEFDEIRGWLRKKIHSKGRTHPTQELIQDVTGRELSEKPFIKYAEQKYSDIYL